MQKTALILGGTRGLGLALAHQATEREFFPVICGRSVKDVERIKKFPLDSQHAFFDAELCGDFVQNLTSQQKDADIFIYNSGELLVRELRKINNTDLTRLCMTNLIAAITVVRDFHALRMSRKRNRRPYHLVIIGSTSAFRIRENQEVYCAAKAGLAHFARNFGPRLSQDLPGSKTILVNPGGMKTGLFKGSNVDTKDFMNPNVVAGKIWEEIAGQKDTFLEVNIFRSGNSSMKIQYGPEVPEHTHRPL